ncbi:MAG: ribonuclease H-like domain-containing protein [Planctomycetota bacterium]
MSQLDRLREALRTSRALGGTPERAPEPRPRTRTGDPALGRILGGGWISSERGPTFLKETAIPGEHRHGEVELGSLLRFGPSELALVAGPGAELTPERVGFLDIETTALSGGTGTCAFLVGLGRFRGGEFVLRQYFLADLAEEPALLSALASEVSGLDALATYNGRAFDLPVLEARSTLARLGTAWCRRPHVDLLRPVRRLWGPRLASCRLVEAETATAGFRREGDVPSEQVPSIYFDYLRAGRIAPLRAVFRHNAWDIASMAAILASVLRLLSSEAPSGAEAAWLGRWWELEGRPERAEGLYRTAISSLDAAGPAAAEWAFAARRYAFLRKRAGARREVVELWRRLWAAGDARAGVEIAKYLEHEARDLRAAEEVARRLLEAAPADERPELERRLCRIRSKGQSWV